MQAFNVIFPFFSATYSSSIVCRRNLLYMCGRDTLTRGKPCDYCMTIQVWGLILRGKPRNYSCLACMCSTCAQCMWHKSYLLSSVPLLPPCSQLLQETRSKEIEQLQLHKMHQFVLFHEWIHLYRTVRRYDSDNVSSRPSFNTMIYTWSCIYLYMCTYVHTYEYSVYVVQSMPDHETCMMVIMLKQIFVSAASL